ncbi:response regulator transcription factor [Halobacillus seohaensis]|uniref:Response regulator n=1 Tax=Halobacillus seohaensis TaxID=447421 RepID=A0ABW2ESG4_9BACI
MSLKVLIVDDEPIICQGLSRTVPWEDLGAEVVGEAYDGEEALEFMDEEDVDLVLSDVRMPVMDGLELAEQIRCQYPQTRMIIISGYDEFDYAKRAMRQGVKDYLLKPVDINELMKLVEITRDHLVKEKQDRLHLELKQLLSSFAIGREEYDDDEAINKELGAGCQLIATEIQGFSEKTSAFSDKEITQMKHEWLSLIEEELENVGMYAVSLFIEENRLITCCTFEKEQLEDDTYHRILTRIKDKLPFQLFLCYAPVSKTVDDLRSHFQLLQKGMQGQVFVDVKVCKAVDVVNILKQFTYEYPVTYEKELNRVEDHDEEKLQQITDRLFETFRANQWPLESVVEALVEIENKIFKDFSEGLHGRITKDVNVTVHNSYQQLSRLFMDDLKDFFSHQQVVMKKGGQRWLIKKALAYINEFYAQDLKATEVADVINVSPNHFSQLIKKETSKHFNDYLHDVRIRQAKLLLNETSYRIYEVAELVGYKDYKYFVQIFKKSTSLTPTQFRTLADFTEGDG